MPDVIPEYDAVTERLELGYLGEDTDNNQTYEKVEDVVERAGLGSQGIGMLSFRTFSLFNLTATFSKEFSKYCLSAVCSYSNILESLLF